MNQNVETFIGCDCPYDEAKIVLFGAPFDSTTSFRPALGLPAEPSGEIPLGSKPTALIRT